LYLGVDLGEHILKGLRNFQYLYCHPLTTLVNLLSWPS